MRHRHRQRPRFIKPSRCELCDNNEHPDYKNPELLKKFINDREKIIGRNRNGLCAKHQRRLSKAIKRARYLAFIPFSQKVH